MHSISKGKDSIYKPVADSEKDIVGISQQAFGRNVSESDAATFVTSKENKYEFVRWKNLGERTYSPKPSAFTHCGLVYRGDTRDPDYVFNNGFLPKNKEKIKDDDEFYKALYKSKLIGRSRFFSDCLVINEETTVCSSKNPFVAAYFPKVVDNESYTYVYCCFVHTGVKVFETVEELKQVGFDIGASQTAEEVFTPEIPETHVVCAWKTKRTKLSIPFYTSYKPSFGSPIHNDARDPCVTEFLKENIIPSLHTAPAPIIKINTYGFMTFQNV
jgi:hypothetical protein